MAEFEIWLHDFRAATGHHLAYLVLDMDWNYPWRSPVLALAKVLHENGIPLVVIYNGDDRATSDREWVAQAVGHFKAFESVIAPSGVSFQTWVGHPAKILPDTDRDSLTGLVLRYAAWKAAHSPTR